MLKELNKWFINYKHFRKGFYIVLILAVVANSLNNLNSNFFILYIFAAIFLGIGYFNKPLWFLLLFTIVVVICRLLTIQDSGGIIAYIIYLFTYFLITLISSGLMMYSQKVKEDNLHFTEALAKALDSRDPYTRNHSEKVAQYAVKIGKQLNLSKEECENIQIGGLLHDIGKIGIPESILSKPGELTDEEYKKIKEHTVIGYEMLKHIQYYHESGILDIVLYHHERYDGKGYPKGLKGEQIPLMARIVAIADSFDAMHSNRIYRNKSNLESIIKEIEKNKGSQFDPKLVDIFISTLKYFR